MLDPRNRRSTNIEDRRGQKDRPSDESDKYPMAYPWPPPMSEDINDPLSTEYELETHIPIYKARRDLDTAARATREWLLQGQPRRKSRIGYPFPAKR